ncbi:MAG: N-acetylmuramidase family protein [Clostridiaceae bacterium]|nr:N-acetylmuramidase family protein [Clostridiaceae bacterium]
MPDDIARAAAALGCDLAAVRAVCQVEAPGGGFLPDGRPKILFEAHIFHRLTSGRYDGAAPTISSPIWDRSLYGPEGGHQYERLAAAVALDEVSAVQSASWGLFQVLGENFRRCGFASVHAFVAAMTMGEGAHLDAFVRYVSADSRMVAALRSSDWPTFARLYNGRRYADNQYDVKLAAAYATAGTTEV